MKIILAVDGSEFSVEAAKKLGEMISTNDKTVIRIINAVEIVAPSLAPFSKDRYSAEEEASLQAAKRYVNDAFLMLREALGEKSVEIETETISGNTKEIILREAEKWKADLIVVGSHGHGFWNRMLLGSVSNSVVRHAKCSVLVVRK